MGTYRSSHPMMSEANRTASIPRFSWFHPGTFLSSARTGCDPFQPTYINADVGTTPIPLHSVTSPPPNEIATNDNDTAIEHAEAKRPKNSKSKKTAENIVSKALKPKQTKKDPRKPSKKEKANSIPLAKRERKDLTIVMYEGNVDISDVPTPFCSCTGVARQCYRWGAGGWQSSCCTINISEYPLPMNVTRPGSRMAGRKMSHGAYEKLLRRLSAECFDLSHPIDLKQHWARHGTNKFVTIK